METCSSYLMFKKLMLGTSLLKQLSYNGISKLDDFFFVELNWDLQIAHNPHSKLNTAKFNFFISGTYITSLEIITVTLFTFAKYPTRYTVLLFNVGNRL